MPRRPRCVPLPSARTRRWTPPGPRPPRGWAHVSPGAFAIAREGGLNAAPHGGESLTALLARVRTWLEKQAALDGTAIAITHGGVVKAAVVAALDAPPSAFWRVDVSPLSITELHAHDGRWTVTRVNDREDTRVGA